MIHSNLSITVFINPSLYAVKMGDDNSICEIVLCGQMPNVDGRVGAYVNRLRYEKPDELLIPEEHTTLVTYANARDEFDFSNRILRDLIRRARVLHPYGERRIVFSYMGDDVEQEERHDYDAVFSIPSEIITHYGAFLEHAVVSPLEHARDNPGFGRVS